MADWKNTNKKQSISEIRQWDFDFNDDLLTGVTVSSATSTHTPPSGSAVTPVVGTIAAGIVPVKLGPLAAGQTGTHFLTCLATLSNGEKSEIKLTFQVDF